MLNKHFTPHPGKPVEFLKSVCDFIFYGGARGGGKSFNLAWKAALTPRRYRFEYKGDPITRREYEILKKAGKFPKAIVEKISIDYPDFIGILIRRTYPQLERNLKPECDKLYKLYGGKWKERSHCYEFPSGAIIYLVHCSDVRAKDNYVGGNYNFIGFDEVNMFPIDWVMEIATSNRTTNPELKPQVCMTSNPGNLGHLWLKKMFVDRCTPIAVGKPELNEEYDMFVQKYKTAPPYIDSEGISYQFIPATVFDNPSLLDNDPKYVRRLKNLPPLTRAMWLEGRWDTFSGMYFDKWDPVYHVVKAKDFRWMKEFNKETHLLYRFYDYGTKKPFVCAFAALDRDENMIIFDEIVETGLSSSRQAKFVKKYTKKKYGLSNADFEDDIADPSMWVKASENEKGDLYSAQMFYSDKGIFLTKGNNDRPMGARVMYEALTIPESGIPRLRFTDNCEYMIETIPALPEKEFHPEDVDTKAEDHGYDAVRYGAMKLLAGAADDVEKNEKEDWRLRLKNRAEEDYDESGVSWITL